MACLGYAIFEQDTRLIALLVLAVIFDKFDDWSLSITHCQPLSVNRSAIFCFIA